MLAAMVGEAAARSDPGMSFSTYSITLNSILYQLGLLGLRAEWRFWARQLIPQDDGGEGGIRTPGRGLSPYNGLANRRLKPLGHLSAVFVARQVQSFAPLVYHQDSTRGIRIQPWPY